MADSFISPDAVGKIVQVKGDAHAVSDSGIRALEAGSEIFKGEILVTKAGGAIEVVFRDDTALSQGENSEIRVDNFIYDPEDPSGSDLLLNMTKGVFRTVTGEIAEKNPDHFKLKSPLATIGIRGTTVVSEVRDGMEKHGVEKIGANHVLVVQDALGNIQFIDSPERIVDLLEGKAIGDARAMTGDELDYFRSAAPITSDGEGNGDDDAGDDAGDGDEDTGDEATGDSEETADDGEGADEVDVDEGLILLSLIDFSDLAAPLVYSVESFNTPVDLVADSIDSNNDDEDEQDSDTEVDTVNFISGTSASEFISGTDGDDSINGGAGHDTLSGGQGNDTLDGGNAQGEFPNDVAWYHDDPSGVTVNLHYTKAGGYAGSTATDGWGNTDTLVNIGGITGSKYADAITIDAEDLGIKDDIHWYVMGMEGNDTITGAGSEEPAAVYIKDPAGVTVDLGNGTATDGWGNTDTLVNIRVTAGSQYADTLTGTDNADGDLFVLTEGDDLINGEDGEKDEIECEYLDTLDNFDHINVNLDTSTAEAYDTLSGLMFTDTLSSIEDISGSQGNDSLLGDIENNRIEGYEGDDTISGGAGGLDSLLGGKGSDYFELVYGNSDTIMDFTINSTEGNDCLRFYQSDLVMYVSGSGIGSGQSGDNLDDSAYSIIKIMDQANADFSNKEAVIDGVINATSSGMNSYVLLSNGADTRAYYFNSDGNGAVENSELTQLAELQGFTDLAGMDADNLQVV